MKIGTNVQRDLIARLPNESTELITWEEELANAIIIQAVKDYRAILKRKRPSHKDLHEHKKQECEDFFHSEWFSILTKVDGDLLMRRIQEECRNESNSRAANGKLYRYRF